MGISPGKKFRLAVDENNPLQVVGIINAYCAIMAEKVGVKALYLSGAGVSNASIGVPDLAITTLNDVIIDAERITNATNLPLLVDVDTGWGGAFNITRMVKQLIKSGVAAIHIEDQVGQKRCGHRPGKILVDKNEMNDRIKTAVDARIDPDFVIMARTDSYQKGGLNEVIERSCSYIENGADMIFAEAIPSIKEFKIVSSKCSVPVLANITEFGKTALLTTKELNQAGVKLALYPLSAFRAMNEAALNVFKTITIEGSQKSVVNKMQTREQLYDFLDYLQYEEKIDKLNN